jgi:hypothetical protein
LDERPGNVLLTLPAWARDFYEEKDNCLVFFGIKPRFERLLQIDAIAQLADVFAEWLAGIDARRKRIPA